MRKFVKASAPGKLIISGEHAVVYGYPAIASAVDKRLTISILKGQKEIKSDIPIGAGMGSSAAFAVATSALRVGELNLERINSLAYGIERKLHGNASGIDNTISTYGGFLWYRKESENLKLFKQIPLKTKLPRFYILNSGKPAESTRQMVEYVAGTYKKRKIQTVNIFREIETITKEFLRFLTQEEKNNFGKLIQENERLLEKLGVVSESTKEIIKRIEKTGGFAKISGAGGIKEGSGMVLIYHGDLQKLKSFAKKNDLILMPVKLGEEGVKFSA